MAIRTANNQSLTEITAFPSAVALGGLVLLETQTASGDGTLDFTSGIDSTYKEYQFHFINIHPETNDVMFTFQTDTGTNTSYNQTMTTTFLQTRHTEDDTTQSGALTYTTNRDQSQGTAFQKLNYDLGNGNDECLAGILHLYDPSNTTFVKNFISRVHNYGQSDESADCFVTGYVNTTTALTRVQFKMTDGDIDAGTIKLYGVT